MWFNYRGLIMTGFLRSAGSFWLQAWGWRSCARVEDSIHHACSKANSRDTARYIGVDFTHPFFQFSVVFTQLAPLVLHNLSATQWPSTHTCNLYITWWFLWPWTFDLIWNNVSWWSNPRQSMNIWILTTQYARTGNLSRIVLYLRQQNIRGRSPGCELNPSEYQKRHCCFDSGGQRYFVFKCMQNLWGF